MVPVPPTLQLYEVAPLAVKVAELPEQIVAGLAVKVTAGGVITDTLTVLVLVQPLPLVPVTV